MDHANRIDSMRAGKRCNYSCSVDGWVLNVSLVHLNYKRGELLLYPMKCTYLGNGSVFYSVKSVLCRGQVKVIHEILVRLLKRADILK